MGRRENGTKKPKTINDKRKTIESASPWETSIRFRAIVLGTLLIFVDNYWVIQMEKVRGGPFPTIISLFLNVVFILLLLLILNRLVGQWKPRWTLNQAELLLVYTMVCIGAAFAGLDMASTILEMTAHPHYYADDSNGWKTHLLPYLPPSLVVTDTEALKGYFNGDSTLYRWEHVRAWLVPLGWWLLFGTLLWWMMLCLCALVRKAWTDEERLTYPLVELPMQMTESRTHLWQNRLFWSGFVLASSIELLNGLHFLYPTLPEVGVKAVDLLPYFQNKPWNAIGWMPYSFYPFVIGIGYLLPLDLVFSCWFFYFFWKAQLVVSSAMGWDIVPEFPFIREQSLGGLLAMVIFLLFGSRNFLRRLVRHLLGRPSDLQDTGEALSYRTASMGFLLGLVGLTLFLYHFGMHFGVALGALLLYVAISFAVTRIRAELGPPVHDLHFSGPDLMLTRWFGTQGWAPTDLTMLNFFWWFNRAYRSHPMPFGLEGLKIAALTGASLRVYFWAMLWAGVIGIVATYWAFLHSAYLDGAAAKFQHGTPFAWEAYPRLSGWIQSPTPPNLYGCYATAFGFAVGWALLLIRSRFFGFPFHPIGFIISGNWSMNLVWTPLLIAWLIKLSLLRFGGLRLYRAGIPFFLGLIIGEALIGCLWSLIGILWNIPTYSFWGP